LTVFNEHNLSKPALNLQFHADAGLLSDVAGDSVSTGLKLNPGTPEEEATSNNFMSQAKLTVFYMIEH
jgi:hypothetical protein